MNIFVYQVNLNYPAEVCGNLTLDMYNETQVRRIQMMKETMMTLVMMLIADNDDDNDKDDYLDNAGCQC